MSWIPGWDSIAAATWWSSFYFWAGIVALLSLGISEVISHRYSERKDELVSEQQAAADRAHNEEIARLHLETADANARAAEASLALAQFKAARSLSQEQQQRIADKLKQFAGTMFDAAIGPKGDPEPLYLIRDISSALLLARWEFIPWTGGGETYTEPPMPAIGLTMVTNVIVDVHPDRWEKLGTAATRLAEALAGEGIAAIADSKPTSVNTDAIHIRIGRKF